MTEPTQPTTAPVAPEPPLPSAGEWSSPPPQQPSRKRRWLLVAVAAVLAAGGITAALLLSGDSSQAKLHIAGTFTLSDMSGTGGIVVTGDKTCTGSGGYSDIQAGSEVVISDDKGATLAITHLAGGGGLSVACVFDFSADVPAGKGFYGVTVSHRGTVKMSEAEVTHAAVSLGS